MIKVVSLDSVERNIALIPANQTWCARESCGLETGSIQNMRQRGKKKKTHTQNSIKTLNFGWLLTPLIFQYPRVGMLNVWVFQTIVECTTKNLCRIFVCLTDAGQVRGVGNSDWLGLSMTFYLPQPGHEVCSGQHDVVQRTTSVWAVCAYKSYVADDCRAKSCIRDWNSHFIIS